MNGYLGETIVPQHETIFKGYERIDWCRQWIADYGHIDGEHHKQWLIVQLERIIAGDRIELKIARWDNGHQELRANLIMDEGFIAHAEEEGLDLGIAP